MCRRKGRVRVKMCKEGLFWDSEGRRNISRCKMRS